MAARLSAGGRSVADSDGAVAVRTGRAWRPRLLEGAIVLVLAICSMRVGGRRARLGTATLSAEELRARDANPLALSSETTGSLPE